MEKEKMLFVHDRNSKAALLRKILENSVHVTEECDPSNVIARVKRSPFDIVLLDCEHLGPQGPDVIRRVKKENSAAIIIALTSSAMEQEVEALRAGADYVSGRENGLEETVFFVRLCIGRNYLRKALPGFPPRLFYDIAKAGSRARRQGLFLKYALCTAIARVRGDGGSLMILDERRGELNLATAYGLDDSARNSARKRLGEKIAGWVAEKKEGVILNGRLDTDGRFSGFSKKTRAIVSAMSVPLIAEGEGIGTMNINTFSPSKGFTSADLKLLVLMGHEIGEGLLRVREVEMLEGERTEALKDMARMLSDRVNNPLASIFINLNELLRQKGFAEKNESRAILEDCLLGAEKIKGVMASLKKLWRIS